RGTRGTSASCRRLDRVRAWQAFINARGAPRPRARAAALEDSLSSRGPRALLSARGGPTESRIFTISLAVMRIRARLLLCALTFLTVSSLACERLLRQYEYQEDIYVSLDGSATVYVTGSLAALTALHGAPFDASQRASVDRAAVVRFFSTPLTHVRRVAPSRRAGRPFVHVRIDVDDIRSLGQTTPFAGSTYAFSRGGELLVYRQAVGATAGRPVAPVDNFGWTGREMVAFRLHLPSKITYH